MPGEMSGCEEKNSLAGLLPPTWRKEGRGEGREEEGGVTILHLACKRHYWLDGGLPSFSLALSLSTCPSLWTAQSCKTEEKDAEGEQLLDLHLSHTLHRKQSLLVI